MDPGLLELYNEELAHLREVGAEFAQAFPKIAARLTMDGIEVADPYVERLLEGFAFLAARVQLKLKAEYPQFVQHLLETLYPNALAPTPSMAVLRLQPDLSDPHLVKGARVARGSAVHVNVNGATSPGSASAERRCEFRTAHEVCLWPLDITAVRYSAHTADLPLAQLPVARQARSSLRLRLRLHGGARWETLPLDTLSLHLSGPDDIGQRLHALLVSALIGSWVPVPPSSSPSTNASTQWRHAEDSLRTQGFADHEALLPETLRGFSGHRLMQEYAALPQRFLFVELTQLRTRLARVSGTEAEVVLLFDQVDPSLEALVDAEALTLFCTPAINLFPRRLDRIQLSPGTAHTEGSSPQPWEHHVVPDRARPMDFEVHSLLGVTGYGVGPVAEQSFLPLYSTFHPEPMQHAAYYSLRREPRLLSPRQQQQGSRSSYVGTEVYLSLVDPLQAPYAEDVRQLALSALVTNRDLPLLIGSSSAWALETPGAVKSVQALHAPSAPQVRWPRGELGWQLISQLTLNHLSIVDEAPERAAAALRSLLALHGPQQGPWPHQIEGIRAVNAQVVTRRLPFEGPLTFGRGVQIDVTVDELAFQGHSAVLLGAVLEHYFARQAAINSFTLTRLHSTHRGLLMQWPARVGTGQIL
jgi:type VI secretion system protein ImpG